MYIPDMTPQVPLWYKYSPSQVEVIPSVHPIDKTFTQAYQKPALSGLNSIIQP